MSAAQAGGYYIGLMSGTSMDGIDAVLVHFDGRSEQPTLHARSHTPYTDALTQQLSALCQSGTDEAVRLGQADRAVGRAFAGAVTQLLEQAGITADAVRLIGSHGQTVRHHPDGELGFSLQIGCADTIATLTGIDTVADFRRKDIALGGQGAPLVPAFHQALFAHADAQRILLNIGGIANLSILDGTTNITGFDTGPGNTLLDSWCLRHTGQPFDRDGAWAASGTPDMALLSAMRAEPYFARPLPKSTGRELFNLHWLQQFPQIAQLEPADVQATLLALTATTIADACRGYPHQQVYLCGGGAHNRALRLALQAALPDATVALSDVLGVPVDDMEAIAFAWLAYCYARQRPSNLPAVTGACRAAVLGVLHRAN